MVTVRSSSSSGVSPSSSWTSCGRRPTSVGLTWKWRKRTYSVPARTCPRSKRDLPVPARLADGRRDSRVQRDPLDPAGVEHERRSLDLPVGADREAGHEEEAAANVLGRVDLELDAVRGSGVGLRSLAERVQQAEEAEQSERREHGPAHERPPLAADEVAVPLQSQPVRRRGHAEQFARGESSPTGEAATLRRLRAPVAQGIERCPAEAEVARSNRAGRIARRGEALGAEGAGERPTHDRPHCDVRDRVGDRPEHDSALSDGAPPMTRARAATRIGFATAAAKAYERSEPRWSHATGCASRRLARIDSSRRSIRAPLPENQSSQCRSIQRQEPITRRTTAVVAAA